MRVRRTVLLTRIVVCAARVLVTDDISHLHSNLPKRLKTVSFFVHSVKLISWRGHTSAYWSGFCHLAGPLSRLSTPQIWKDEALELLFKRTSSAIPIVGRMRSVCWLLIDNCTCCVCVECLIPKWRVRAIVIRGTGRGNTDTLQTRIARVASLALCPNFRRGTTWKKSAKGTGKPPYGAERRQIP
jgi:hypothetical protein